jgi:hypothetical protein
MIGRLAQLAQATPRATLAVPLLLVQVAMVLAVLGLLGPAIFMRRRAPFERLVVILELALGRNVGQDQRPSPERAGRRR